MKKILYLLLLTCMYSVVSAEIAHLYEIELTYDNGIVSHSSIDVTLDETNKGNRPGGYIAEVLDSNQDVLHVEFFMIPRRVYYDNVENGSISSGGMVELNESEVTLFLPYFEQAQAIVIYNSEVEELHRIGVSEFSVVLETLIEDESDVGIQENEVVKSEQKSAMWNWTLLFLGLLLLMIVIGMARPRKARK